MLLKRAKFELPTLPLLVILLGAGSAAVLPFSLWEIAHGEHEHLARDGYLALAYTGVIGGAFMYFLYNWSVAVLGASRAGTLIYTQTIFATFFAWLILGERIEWYHFAGGGLVIVGHLVRDAAAAQTGTRKRDRSGEVKAVHAPAAAWRLRVQPLDRPHDPARSLSPTPKIRCSPTGPAAFGLPPFARHQAGAFPPGLRCGALAAHRAEIEAIAADPAAPTFDNTIVALEKSGRALDRVANVFFVLAGANTSDAIEAVEREMSPLLARHSNALYLNRALYARIADLYARRDSARPDARAGARARPLPHPLRARGRRARQAGAGPARGNQRAAGEPRHPVRAERAGRREGLRADAGGGRSRRPAGFRPRRRARGGGGARGIPANTPSRWRARPARRFCNFPTRRDLREKIFQAWIKRGENGGATDNRAHHRRDGRACAPSARKLLGFETFADYRLDDQMAKTPAAARKLLDEVWSRARAKAQAERDALQEMIAEEGGNFALAPWDWRYYAEKLRKAELRSWTRPRSSPISSSTR